MAKGPRRTSRAQAREAALAAAAAVSVPRRADVVVCGGGAAGLVAGIAAAEAGASVVVLERDLTCGRSILATGNGRCNLMNQSLVAGGAWGNEPSWQCYNDPAFVAAVCGRSFGEDVLAFFSACGLATTQEGEGRIYPLSLQASSVREVLLVRARRAGVVLAPAREVTALSADGSGAWRVCLGEKFGTETAREVTASAVVLASGGGSALARGAGLACADNEPVLCPLACEALVGVRLDALDGRRVHATARLLRSGKEIGRELGEVLFRGYGLSGIVIFNLSRLARPGDVISLNLLGGIDVVAAQDIVTRAGTCAGLMDPAIALVFPGSPEEVVKRASDLRFVVKGPAEPERAQVTRGGLHASQFDPDTLEAAPAGRPGLFAAGEALNVDGACGGFNLAWAWKSGLVAGAAAAVRTLGTQKEPRGITMSHVSDLSGLSRPMIDISCQEDKTTMLSQLEAWFSPARMVRFTHAESPSDLYVWDARLSKALLEDIGHVEVLLRNFISRRLSTDCERTTGDPCWYEHPELYNLNNHFVSSVTKAKCRLSHEGHTVTLDRMTAALSLDVWRFLLTKRLEPTVWKALRARQNGGMPHYPRMRRDTFERDVANLYYMRNRCAHQEHLVCTPLEELALVDSCVKAIWLTAARIDPEAAEWIRSHSRLDSLLFQRPDSREITENEKGDPCSR